MSITAKVYIARHERYEAAEAYEDKLSPFQIRFLKENERDFWLEISDIGTHLLLIEDEG
jgi:hypothetical protein